MIELIGVEPGTRLRIAGGITAEVLESLSDEWVRVRLTEVPVAMAWAPRNCATPAT